MGSGLLKASADFGNYFLRIPSGFHILISGFVPFIEDGFFLL
jgi:hypothetical protein